MKRRFTSRIGSSASLSSLTSAVIHMVVMIAIALAPLGNKNAPGDGTGLGGGGFIGIMPGEPLAQGNGESWDSLDSGEVMWQTTSAEDFEDPAEVAAPIAAGAHSDAALEVATNPLSASSGGGGSGSGSGNGGGGIGGFDLGSGIGGGSGGAGGGGDWEGTVQGLRRHGLDIVILFDSTGSMSGEIEQVTRKSRASARFWCG